ncbi:MAG: hypothetical protein ABW252_01860 [Polyangiales bacterium]
MPRVATRARWWALLVLSACGGSDAPTREVDENSSTADDAGVPGIDAGAAARDAEVARIDARFVPAVHGGHGDGGGPCDPVAQAGCEAGAQCDLTERGFTCVPAGDLAPFGRCDAPGVAGVCRAGSTCVVTPFDDARCAAFCDPATGSGCPGNGQTCAPIAESDGAIGTCVSAHQCSPVAQDCADPTQSCTWTPLGAFCVTASDFVANGGACDSAASCEAGSTCVDDGAGVPRCYRQCDPAHDGGGCAADEYCDAFAEVWLGRVGACRFAGSSSMPPDPVDF